MGQNNDFDQVANALDAFLKQRLHGINLTLQNIIDRLCITKSKV